jgi:hypothetical protein
MNPQAKRVIKRIVIVLVVLAIVFVGGDFALATAGEYQLSTKIKNQLGLSQDPSVTIHGFPVLFQAISGDYTDISISATGVPAARSAFRDLEIDADLHDVRVPLSELLSGNVSSAKIDHVDGRVKVKATDLGRLLNLPDLTITPMSVDTILGMGAEKALQPHAAEPDASVSQNVGTVAGVELSATIDIAGQQTKINAFGVITLSGGGIQVNPRRLEASNSQISGALPDAMLQSFAHMFTTNLSTSQLPLPFTVRATGVEVDQGALVVTGEADNILFNSGNISQ